MGGFAVKSIKWRYKKTIEIIMAKYLVKREKFSYVISYVFFTLMNLENDPKLLGGNAMKIK